MRLLLWHAGHLNTCMHSSKWLWRQVHEKSLEADHIVRELGRVKRDNMRLEITNKDFQEKILLNEAMLSNYRLIQDENRELYNRVQDLQGNIRVFCRCVPHAVLRLVLAVACIRQHCAACAITLSFAPLVTVLPPSPTRPHCMVASLRFPPRVRQSKLRALRPTSPPSHARVACRVRPTGATGDSTTACIDFGQDNDLAIYHPTTTKRAIYKYNKVFAPDSTQDQVCAVQSC